MGFDTQAAAQPCLTPNGVLPLLLALVHCMLQCPDPAVCVRSACEEIGFGPFVVFVGQSSLPC